MAVVQSEVKDTRWGNPQYLTIGSHHFHIDEDEAIPVYRMRGTNDTYVMWSPMRGAWCFTNGGERVLETPSNMSLNPDFFDEVERILG